MFIVRFLPMLTMCGDVLLNRFSHRGAKFSKITGSIYVIDPVLEVDANDKIESP